MLLLLSLLYEALASQLAWALHGGRFRSSAGLCLGIPEVLRRWRSKEGGCCKGRDPGALWGKLEEFERSHDSTGRSLWGDGEENAVPESAFWSSVSPQWECGRKRADFDGASPAHHGRQQLVNGQEATMKFCLSLCLESLSLSSQFRPKESPWWDAWCGSVSQVPWLRLS